VLGPIDHSLFKSIYFFDPSGHRLELAANTGGAEMWRKAADVADDMLAEWNQKHGTVRQASWLHQKEFDESE